jgi:CHAT domain-containing protein
VLPGQVIATAWPIDDRSTARFMAAFYDRLAGGAPTAEALAQVQRETLRRSATRNPSFWAGFLLSGGPQ